MLALDDLALAADARSLSLDLFPGDGYAVMGPARSGKAVLMDVLLGRDKAHRGKVRCDSRICQPREREYARRHTPQGLAKSLAKRSSGARLTEVLSALGLWDVRQTPVTSLEESQQAACDLLSVFLTEPAVALIDGQVDFLDPWARESLLELIDDGRKNGAAYVVATNLPAVAQRLGGIVVYSGMSPVYAGPVSQLLRATVATELVVQTDDPTTTRSMVEPFALSIRQEGNVLNIEADKGQELAARLLTMGYGSVGAVIVKEPTLAEALRQLV